MGFFDSIINWFNLIGQAIYNFVIGLGQLLKVLPEILGFSLSTTSFIPVFLVSFFILGFTLKVVLVIIGRK